jgi:hypothetical protein
MQSARHIIKAGTAVGISLWIAVVACVIGCTLPVIAESQASVDASSRATSAATSKQAGLMAEMENCHHSGGDPTVPTDGKKPGPNGAVSCCPLEVTLTQKWDTSAARVDLSHDFAVSIDFNFAATRVSSGVESAPSLWHGGRETLLETHLLRI